VFASLRGFVTRNPARAITIVVVVVAALIAVLLVATSDRGDDTVARKRRPPATQPTPPPARLKLRIGDVHVRSIGKRIYLRRPVRNAVLRKTQQYVDGAIIAPLERGRAAPGWAQVFDPWVRRYAKKRDLADLTEVKMGFRKERVRATASKVRVDAIGSPAGRPALVALTWTMRVNAGTAKRPLNIRRRTELTFANEYGKWLVTAYQVDVTRSDGKQKKTKKAKAARPA
jgi:hypothetical protein